jgi:Kef-type K+ transport system membrane component KefB
VYYSKVLSPSQSLELGGDNESAFANLIEDLAVILGIAALMIFRFQRIQESVVLEYIIAGHYTPDKLSVTDTDNIKIWAELGVIFLMFSLGLEFRFRGLARVGIPQKPQPQFMCCMSKFTLLPTKGVWTLTIEELTPTSAESGGTISDVSLTINRSNRA